MALLLKATTVILTLLWLPSLGLCRETLATRQVIPKSSAPAAAHGLQRVHGKGPAIIYARPDAPKLNTYQKFIIAPVKVSYLDPQMFKVAPWDIERMQKYFHQTLQQELASHGYQIVKAPAKGVLLIEMTITGLRKRGSKIINDPGIGLTYPIGVGSVTVEGRFLDSLSNRLDYLVVHKQVGSPDLKAQTLSDWGGVEATFDKWAEKIRQAVEQK